MSILLVPIEPCMNQWPGAADRPNNFLKASLAHMRASFDFSLLFNTAGMSCLKCTHPNV
jgi:hypothetical protein